MAKRHLITREDLGKRLTAGADAREPTLAGASGGGLNVFGAVDGAKEPAAEMPDAVEPGVPNDPPSVEDRLQVAGNGTALQGSRTCRAYLAPGPVQSLQVRVQSHRRSQEPGLARSPLPAFRGGDACEASNRSCTHALRWR